MFVPEIQLPFCIFKFLNKEGGVAHCLVPLVMIEGEFISYFGDPYLSFLNYEIFRSLSGGLYLLLLILFVACVVFVL